jgi:membrane-bound lytic murein transglycosylase D
MTPTHHTIVKSIVFLALTLILSSCADKNHFGGGSDHASPGIVNNGDSSQPDQEVQTTEPEMCLDQELNELSLTGFWNEPYSPLNFDPTQNVFFDFPVVLNKQVEMYLHFFQTRFREQFAQWLQRSTVYHSMMEAELAEAGLPRDLAYLAMIESGYNPTACSRSMAVGLWQFMEGTGLQYNLEIDKFVDERRHPEKATRAAVAFLADLYREFGDWHLAIAAYNGGPGKIRTGLAKYKSSNFWELASQDYLSLETKRYVPKLIAALIIAKQPEKFGFTNLTYYTPPRYDILNVKPGMSLEGVALISNCDIGRIKQLNPELRQDKTPLNVSEYELRIPEATAKLALKNISRLHPVVSTNYKSHKIVKGDTLTSICAQYDVNKTTLLKANNLRSGKLSNGQNLRIPYNTTSYQLLPEQIAKTSATSRENLVMHLVKPGDTVSRISRLYNVPVEMVMAWNGLKNVKAVRPGQQLALYTNQGKASNAGEALAAVDKTSRPGPDKPAILALKADHRKTHVTEVRATDAYASYNVQDGDTLWTISQKFSASTTEIKKLNNLKSDLIYPGIVLKLKKA